MEDKKISICVDQISKIYKLYEKPSDRMKEALGLTRKKIHKESYALRNVDMTIYQGETVGIIGTNGSGKSTILKIITGVLNPTSGNLTVNGRISALLELGAGLNMEYNGIENVYLNGTMMGFSKQEIDEKLPDLHAKLVTLLGIERGQVTVTVDFLQYIQNDTQPIISFSFPTGGSCAASK